MGRRSLPINYLEQTRDSTAFAVLETSMDHSPFLDARKDGSGDGDSARQAVMRLHNMAMVLG